MNYEFKKLSEVESLAEVPENATVLAEVDGKIKRIPGSGLGGSDIKTAIIKHMDYDNAIEYLKSESSPRSSSAMMSDSSEYYCTNMTFDEAYEIMSAGEPLNVVVLGVNNTPFAVPCFVFFAGVQVFGEPTIVFTDNLCLYETWFWNASGIVTQSESAPPS